MTTKRNLNRRSFLQSTAAASLSPMLLGSGLMLPRVASAQELGAGMIGGPTGFAGAERFQYDGTMSEGRAIEGIKALR